ncbi:hypothetical protein QL285_015713 [Trifolium repens]|nr:hypothetical protein QL285_015713 [Trifolium repens]
MSISVTTRAFGDPGTATSRSSPTPFSIGVFAFRGNRTHVPGDKYMSNPFPLSIGSGNGLNMYLSPGYMVRFPRKAKTPIEKGVGEDREVAVPGSPKARAVTKKCAFFCNSPGPPT